MTTARPVRLLAFTGATEWGGAEIVLGHLLAALGEHVQPTLMGVDAGVLTRVAAGRPGTPLVVVPRVGSKRDLAAIRAQRSAIAAAKPDVVQINLPVPFAEPYTVLAAITVPRARVVVVEHLPMAIPSPKIRLLKRLTSPRLSAHVAVGARAARQVEQLSGLRGGTIRSIPNGVPLPVSERSLRPPGAEFVIGAVGRFHPQKAFDVLVRAVAELPGAHLVLVGDGEQRAALERLVADLGITDRVAMPGWTEGASAGLHSFDVVAIPSRFEGLPLVLLEAMLSGGAIVATGVGSILDALSDGETGLVVPVDDAAALADALRRLRDDPELRLRLGMVAAEQARKRFTASAMAEAYERLYEEILEERRRFPVLASPIATQRGVKETSWTEEIRNMAPQGVEGHGPVTTSLVISTRNRPAFAVAAVRAVLDGNEVPTEIVVVDQSDAENADLSAGIADPRCSLRYLWKPARGLSLGRNTAIAAATGEILLFIDDDIVVPPEWFGRIVASLRRAGGEAVVTGRAVGGEPEVPGAFAPSLHLDPRPTVHRGRPGRDVLLPMNMALYRSVVDVVGGFDERLGVGTRFPSSEDNDFGFRLLEAGLAVVYDPEVFVVHRAWRQPEALLPLRWAYGRGQGAYYAKYWSLRDPYMVRRTCWDVGRHVKRALLRLRTDRRGASADVVYSLAVLTGAVQWLVRRDRTTPVNVDR